MQLLDHILYPIDIQLCIAGHRVVFHLYLNPSLITTIARHSFTTEI